MAYPVKHAGAASAANHAAPISARQELGSDDYVEVALDASCAALMALDLVRTFAADDERVAGRIALAIGALRLAIADLRERHADAASGVSHGFVYDPGRPPGQIPGNAAAGSSRQHAR